MLIPFTKMQGAGNDFVVLDETRTPLNLSREQYRFIANRRFGVGADQILSVRPATSPDVDFSYVIHNADGGMVEHCGNGARCFVRFVLEQGLTTKTSIRVQVQRGIITLHAQPDGQVTVDMGAPVFDAGRRGFPLFAKANKVGDVQWTTMDPPLRETMLVRGDVDAITGFTFTSLLNLEARGVKAADVAVMPFADNGVKLYGNAIIASAKLVRENPDAVRAFLKAFTKGAKEVMANPGAAIAHVKERDGIVNTALETRRLQLAIDTVINTADARAEGFGQVSPTRMALMASQVSDVYATKTRVNPEGVWSGKFLPPAAELDVLPKK